MKRLFKKAKNHFTNFKPDSEKKQKILASVVFVVFFIGLAYVCMQQFPHINYNTHFQNQTNFDTKITPADFNKSIIRDNIENPVFSTISEEDDKSNTDIISREFVTALTKIYKEKNVSVLQSENHNRIITDGNRLFALPLISNASKYEENLIALSEHAKSNKSHVFFVQMPTTAQYIENMPYGIYNDSSRQINRLIDTIRERKNITAIDLRNHDNLGIESFYTNDSQLLPLSSQLIADIVARNTATTFDSDEKINLTEKYSKASNYLYSISKSHFFGDYTQAFGLDIAPATDFKFIEPNFDTDYTTITQNSANSADSLTFSGSMSDSVMDKKVFNSTTDCNKGYLRSGDYCVNVVNNLSKADGASVLVISNGYDQAFATFFSQYVRELTFVDAEHTFFENRIYNLIEQNKYDAIYVLASGSTYESKNFWNFDKK